MSNDAPGPHNTTIVIKISPEVLRNKNKKIKIVKDSCSAVGGLLNSHYGGILKLTSSQSLTPAMIDEFGRGIVQTLIELLGLTGFREYCQTEISGLRKGINFTVKPSDRLCTVEYNLFLPTGFLVMQVLRTEPLEKIAAVLKPGRPFVNVTLQNHVQEFVKESTMPESLRESDKLQFKKVKSDKNKNKSIADRIISNKIVRYIAAFANHKGGHVYIGIEDDTYKVCGQIVVEEERQRIVERIGSAVANMVWPEEHGKPELGKHWDISFVPVLDANKEAIPGLFVIVVAIARCPGGVFLSHPEAYEINDGKVVRMDFKRWKKRLLHDAPMRDIVKFEKRERENSWTKFGTCQVAESEQSDSRQPNQDCISAVCDSGSSSIPFGIRKVSPRNTKYRTSCRKITYYMEQLVRTGEITKLFIFAERIESMDNDIMATVHFMYAWGTYVFRDMERAYSNLNQASSLIKFTRNPADFEVQRLYFLACFSKCEGEYGKSYEIVYGALQKIEGISPGWHTVRVLTAGGHLFSILSDEERNDKVRKSLKQQAISLYTKAIDHINFDHVSSMNSYLLHHCHLRRAMLSLGSKLHLGEKDDGSQEITNEEIGVAISSILVLEEISLKGDSLSKVSECYLYMVKSDLNYRRCQKNMKTARDLATKARDLALKDKIHGVINHAQSRIDRVTKAH